MASRVHEVAAGQRVKEFLKFALDPFGRLVMKASTGDRIIAGDPLLEAVDAHLDNCAFRVGAICNPVFSGGVCRDRDLIAELITQIGEIFAARFPPLDKEPACEPSESAGYQTGD